mmetsp:Transcript_124486/g.311281  ORF Transcript_124486/g.311281 Transcript_124486/m.311281 type:complete len:277 (-) Transcript_124486:2-832(-)
MVARPLEVRHDDVAYGELWNLGAPIADPLRDPGLRHALLDTVVEVQLSLQQTRCQHSRNVGVVALVTATSLEVRLHAVAGAPLTEAGDPAQWHGLLDGVLELDRYPALDAVRHDDADVRARGPPAVVADLEVDVSDRTNLHSEVPRARPLCDPSLGHVLLDIVVKDYVYLLRRDLQDRPEVCLEAFGTPAIVDFEAGHDPVPGLESDHLLDPAHRDGLHDAVLEPDADPAPLEHSQDDAEVRAERPALARGIVRVRKVAWREVQVPWGEALGNPSL